MHVKRGDQVIVIAGNDKGSTGEVIQVMRSENRVWCRANVASSTRSPPSRAPGERRAGPDPREQRPLSIPRPAGTRKRPQA